MRAGTAHSKATRTVPAPARHPQINRQATYTVRSMHTAATTTILLPVAMRRSQPTRLSIPCAWHPRPDCAHRWSDSLHYRSGAGHQSQKGEHSWHHRLHYGKRRMDSRHRRHRPLGRSACARSYRFCLRISLPDAIWMGIGDDLITLPRAHVSVWCVHMTAMPETQLYQQGKERRKSACNSE